MFLLAFVYPAIILGFSVLALRTVFFWSAFIQRKQYRLDRLWQAFKDGEANHLLFNLYRLGLLLFFTAFEFVLRFWTQATVFDALLVLLSIFWLAWGLQTVFLLMQNRLDMPARTTKIIIFVLIASSLEALIAWNYHFWVEILLALEIIAPLFICCLFVLASVPNALWYKYLIAEATAQRNRLPGLNVVGITGSYGKTSTKEYIAHILGSKFRVLKTPQHINVDTGVARIIRKELTKSYDYFIVEMGAYRVGEIASICRMVKPTFAVITALGDQHVELFGSQEKLEKAKFELVDAVKEPARCYANAQSPLLLQAMNRRHLTPVWYGLQAPARQQPSRVRYGVESTTFTLETTNFKIPCFGSTNLINALGAIAFCKDAGMTYPEIAGACLHLPQIPHTLQLQRTATGACLLDCTYNASIDGVEAAIKDLALAEKPHRALVFRQVIELGGSANAEHRRLAHVMAQHLQTVVLLDSPWRQTMVEELLEQGFSKDHILDADHFSELTKRLDQTNIVLFAGRDSASFLQRTLLL